MRRNKEQPVSWNDKWDNSNMTLGNAQVTILNPFNDIYRRWYNIPMGFLNVYKPWPMYDLSCLFFIICVNLYTFAEYQSLN